MSGILNPLNLQDTIFSLGGQINFFPVSPWLATNLNFVLLSEPGAMVDSVLFKIIDFLLHETCLCWIIFHEGGDVLCNSGGSGNSGNTDTGSGWSWMTDTLSLMPTCFIFLGFMPSRSMTRFQPGNILQYLQQSHHIAFPATLQEKTIRIDAYPIKSVKEICTGNSFHYKLGQIHFSCQTVSNW